MGEGSGMLVLEELEHARARGATPLAEDRGLRQQRGTPSASPTSSLTARAQVAAMSQACRQAGIDPTRPGRAGRPAVHYISAHGTGTQENDRIETRAVKALFGELAPGVPFSSVESVLGRLIQAAAAVELITCVQAIRAGWIPPTMNLANQDPQCDLDYVANAAQRPASAGGVDVRPLQQLRLRRPERHAVRATLPLTLSPPVA
jgi:3-oxoacyl-(acyl-carrier-protein) synthase